MVVVIVVVLGGIEGAVTVNTGYGDSHDFLYQLIPTIFMSKVKTIDEHIQNLRKNVAQVAVMPRWRWRRVNVRDKGYKFVVNLDQKLLQVSYEDGPVRTLQIADASDTETLKGEMEVLIQESKEYSQLLRSLLLSHPDTFRHSHWMLRGDTEVSIERVPTFSEGTILHHLCDLLCELAYILNVNERQYYDWLYNKMDRVIAQRPGIIDKVDERGATPLFLAAPDGELVAYLVQQGASLQSAIDSFTMSDNERVPIQLKFLQAYVKSPTIFLQELRDMADIDHFTDAFPLVANYIFFTIAMGLDEDAKSLLSDNIVPRRTRYQCLIFAVRTNNVPMYTYIHGLLPPNDSINGPLGLPMIHYVMQLQAQRRTSTDIDYYPMAKAVLDKSHGNLNYYYRWHGKFDFLRMSPLLVAAMSSRRCFALIWDIIRNHGGLYNHTRTTPAMPESTVIQELLSNPHPLMWRYDKDLIAEQLTRLDGVDSYALYMKTILAAPNLPLWIALYDHNKDQFRDMATLYDGVQGNVLQRLLCILASRLRHYAGKYTVTSLEFHSDWAHTEFMNMLQWVLKEFYKRGFVLVRNEQGAAIEVDEYLTAGLAEVVSAAELYGHDVYLQTKEYVDRFLAVENLDILRKVRAKRMEKADLRAQRQRMDDDGGPVTGPVKNTSDRLLLDTPTLPYKRIMEFAGANREPANDPRSNFSYTRHNVRRRSRR